MSAMVPGMELWTISQIADYWGVSASRARAILAHRRIRRISGYPADKVRAVELKQGARTDLIKIRQHALESNIWRTLTQQRCPATSTDEQGGLVHAVERLISDTEPGPLLTGGITDCLPSQSRAVRICGPLGSGKTVCARRIARQAVTAGRHVTAIRHRVNGLPVDEYALADVNPCLTLVDSESLTTVNGRQALADRFDTRDNLKNGIISDSNTVIVDIPLNVLPLADLHDLTIRLYQALATHSDATLVVLVSGPHDLSAGTPEMPVNLFDTEVVLPGQLGQYPERTCRAALERWTTDDLTLERLMARVGGGGVAASPREQEVLDLFPFGSPEREYLSQRVSRVVEGPQPVIMSGAGNGGSEYRLQHGFLKRPDGKLAEFTLPASSDVPVAR